MINNIWEMLEEYFDEDRSDYFCEGVSDQEIINAQNEIDLGSVDIL